MDKPAEPMQTLLHRLAFRYIWWKTPADAIQLPDLIIAQVTDIGDFQNMEEFPWLASDDRLPTVLAHAQAGQFRQRSWHYWHHRLGLAAAGGIPPMPAKKMEHISNQLGKTSGSHF